MFSSNNVSCQHARRSLSPLLLLKCLVEHSKDRPFEPCRHHCQVIDHTSGQLLLGHSEIAPKPFPTCTMNNKSSVLALGWNQALLLLLEAEKRSGYGLGNRTRHGHSWRSRGLFQDDESYKATSPDFGMKNTFPHS